MKCIYQPLCFVITLHFSFVTYAKPFELHNIEKWFDIFLPCITVAKVSVLHNVVASMVLWCLIAPRLILEGHILTTPHFSLGISVFQSRNLVLWNDVIEAQFVMG
jgi:hypothetical protein